MGNHKIQREAVEDFKGYLLLKRYAKSTREQYLSRIVHFLKDIQKSILEITNEDIELYIHKKIVEGISISGHKQLRIVP